MVVDFRLSTPRTREDETIRAEELVQEFELQIGEDSVIPDRPDEFAGATVGPQWHLLPRRGAELDQPCHFTAGRYVQLLKAIQEVTLLARCYIHRYLLQRIDPRTLLRYGHRPQNLRQGRTKQCELEQLEQTTGPENK